MMKGKVVLVPFPFDDLSTSKVRPAVCLIRPRWSISPCYYSLYQQPDVNQSTGNRPDTKFRACRLRHDRVTSDIHAPAAPYDDGHDSTYHAGIGRIIAQNAG